MINFNRKSSKGFTLIEMLVYIVIFVIIISVIASLFLWLVRSYNKNQAMRETLDNASRIMETMTREIKAASSIYNPTSTSTHPGQLSLETTRHLPTGETTSYIDFYLCGTSFCFKKESQAQTVLTSDKVEVSNLVFTEINAETAPTIQIDLTVDYLNPSGRPEYQASTTLTSTIGLRFY